MTNGIDCDVVRDEFDAYIGKELPEAQDQAISEHLAACEACAHRYATRTRLVAALRSLPEGMSVPEMSVTPPSAPPASPRPAGRRLVIWQAAAGFAACMVVVSVSALSLPAFASQIPGLPVSERLAELDGARLELLHENEALAERVEELEIQVENIGGEQVPVVDTAPDQVAPEVNDAVQLLAMDFIKAQYRGDVQGLTSLSTSRLAAEIEARPEDYVRNTGDVVFAQMTTVGKTEDGTLLVFVRLSDGEFSDSTFQEDFEVRFEEGRYLVDFMGMDA